RLGPDTFPWHHRLDRVPPKERRILQGEARQGGPGGVLQLDPDRTGGGRGIVQDQVAPLEPERPRDELTAAVGSARRDEPVGPQAQALEVSAREGVVARVIERDLAGGGGDDPDRGHVAPVSPVALIAAGPDEGFGEAPV